MSRDCNTLEQVISLVSNDRALLDVLLAGARRLYDFVPGEDHRTPEAAWSDSVRKVVCSAFADDGVVRVLKEKLHSYESCHRSEGRVPSRTEEAAGVVAPACEVNVQEGEPVAVDVVTSDDKPNVLLKSQGDCITHGKNDPLTVSGLPVNVLLGAASVEQPNQWCQHLLTASRQQQERNDLYNSRIDETINVSQNRLQPRKTSPTGPLDGVGNVEQIKNIQKELFESRVDDGKLRIGDACQCEDVLPPTISEQHKVNNDSGIFVAQNIQALDQEFAISTAETTISEDLLVARASTNCMREIEKARLPTTKLIATRTPNHVGIENHRGIVADTVEELLQASPQKTQAGQDGQQTLAEEIKISTDKDTPTSKNNICTDRLCVEFATNPQQASTTDVAIAPETIVLSREVEAEDSSVEHLSTRTPAISGMKGRSPFKEEAVPSYLSQERIDETIYNRPLLQETRPRVEDYANDPFESFIDDKKHVRFLDSALCSFHQIRAKFEPHELGELFYSAEDFDVMCDELEREEEKEREQSREIVGGTDNGRLICRQEPVPTAEDVVMVDNKSLDDISFESYSFYGDDSGDIS